MPSNLEPALTQRELKILVGLLKKFAKWIAGEQPLAAMTVNLVIQWAASEVEQKIDA